MTQQHMPSPPYPHQERVVACRAAAERLGPDLARLRAELQRLEAEQAANAMAEALAREQEQEGEI
jgi:hypothetical protein